jgi:hypothetical protein
VLSRLIDDEGLRQRIGLAGRATVVERYSIQRWESTFADALLNAAG